MHQLTRDPQKESLTPDPDGVITDFDTSSTYVAGTVSIWLNGIRLIESWDDGFTELGGTGIRLKIAPLTGDSVQAQYEIQT